MTKLRSLTNIDIRVYLSSVHTQNNLVADCLQSSNNFSTPQTKVRARVTEQAFHSIYSNYRVDLKAQVADD